MPIKVIGMIEVAPSSDEATVDIIDGGVSPKYLVDVAESGAELIPWLKAGAPAIDQQVSV